jgi:hypothetical protein
VKELLKQKRKRPFAPSLDSGSPRKSSSSSEKRKRAPSAADTSSSSSSDESSSGSDDEHTKPKRSDEHGKKKHSGPNGHGRVCNFASSCAVSAVLTFLAGAEA